jgi:quercetin dioxygenase-like cupin family protein
MPSIERPLSGDVLVFDLAVERERSADPAIMDRTGRSARTLLKDGPLRVTLVVLAAGAELAEHQAEGPITLQPLDGRIRFTALGRSHELGPGEMLAAGRGVRHSVASPDGASFLLTVALDADEA